MTIAAELDARAKEVAIRALMSGVEVAIRGGSDELRRNLEAAIDYLDDAPAYIDYLEREVERLHKLAYLTIRVPKWLQRHKHDWLPIGRTHHVGPSGHHFTRVFVRCLSEGCRKTKTHEHKGKLSVDNIQALYPNRRIGIVGEGDE